MTAQEKEEQRDAQAVALFNGAMNGTALVDPTDADDGQKINRAVEQFVLPLWKERPEEAAKMAMDVIRKLKIVPDALKRQVQGVLLSSDPQKQAQGYALFAQIKREAPEAVGQFAQEARALGVGVWGQVTVGRALGEAFAVTRENLNPTRDPAVRQAREESLKGDEIAQVKTDAIADYWSSRAEHDADGHTLPDGLAVDFSTVFDAEYLRTWSVATVQQEALEVIKNKWAVSDFGGGVGVVQRMANAHGLSADLGPPQTEEIQTAPQIMRYAPEVYYAVPGAPEGWMAEQLLGDVQALATEGARFHLVPDGATKQARQTEKSWPVFMEQDGIYTPLLDARGAPLRWRPSWKDSPAFARLKAEQQADREAARSADMNWRNSQANPPISLLFEGEAARIALPD